MTTRLCSPEFVIKKKKLCIFCYKNCEICQKFVRDVKWCLTNPFIVAGVSYKTTSYCSIMITYPNYAPSLSLFKLSHYANSLTPALSLSLSPSLPPSAERERETSNPNRSDPLPSPPSPPGPSAPLLKRQKHSGRASR